MPHAANHKAAPLRRSPANTTDDERRALWHAVQNGAADTVAELLDSGMSPEFSDGTGTTPLHIAARSDYARIVRLLLAAGADVNAPGPAGATPLHKAAWAGAREACDALLVAGADIGARDENGDTPLHKAMITGRESIAYRMTRMGARLDVPNNKGWTPEDVASMGNHVRTTDGARLGQSLGHAGRYKRVYRQRRGRRGPG